MATLNHEFPVKFKDIRPLRFEDIHPLTGWGEISERGYEVGVLPMAAASKGQNDMSSEVYEGHEYIVGYVVYTDDEENGLVILDEGHDVVKNQSDLDYRVDFLRPYPKGSKLAYRILVEKDLGDD